ncbi:MAG: sulfite exporter TauE/SafE family protein, partial [Bacteroidota bacterium]
GVAGIYSLVVIMLAWIFGGKSSTGILLPILLMADVFGVTFYRRTVQWHYIFRLLPWALVGIGLGTWLGESISDALFKSIMGVVILFGIGVMLWMEIRGDKEVPNFPGLPMLVGLIGGFSTMVGNAAGAVIAVYFLAMRLPKNDYIGTIAVFFLTVNLSKLPSHIWIWETISWRTLSLDLALLPGIAAGAFLGYWIVKKISEKWYRRFVIGVTILSALFLIF